MVKLLFFALVFVLQLDLAFAQDNEACYDCHSDPDMETEQGGKTVSLYVDDAKFIKSVHAELSCTDCHEDAAVEDFPHPERLEPVYCGNCHDEMQLNFDAGIHGQALKRKAIYAPDCAECHGTHEILSSTNPKSQTNKMQVPYLCGKCHREGAPVARVYDITEHNIIENYSLDIHGQGLFEKGLIVTAGCTDCHGSHLILPHSFVNSSVSRANVAKTCMKCHTRIEEVHAQFIRGELWEKQPGAIPVCSDCHLPHKVRKETVSLTMSDRSCLDCHARSDVHKTVEGQKISLQVTKEELSDSQHRNIPCVKCHSDVNPKLKRPCEPSGRVDCSNCHAKISREFYSSVHGNYLQEGDKRVPYCIDCHGGHQVKSHLDETALTFRSSIPQLCGDCHREGGKATIGDTLHTHTALTDYSSSVHGRGLTEKGLLPSAICTDCHNSHMILAKEDPSSSIYRKNIPATCSTCHRGIFKEYIKSTHFSVDEKAKEKLPTCSECHSSHTITSVHQDKFMFEVTHQCGSCHTDLSETYSETMHGKAYTLGYLKAAKCSDCHGAHDILSINDPESRVGPKNVVSTCQKCHSNANERFTGYLTHATHHDKVKYPILYYTYWFMTSLLVGVFSFFGLHTLLWLPRSIRYMRTRKEHVIDEDAKYILRFSVRQRLTHMFVIISFILLALTGMMLKFSNMSWAQFMADFFGGVGGAGLIHRFAAIITFGYFLFHLSYLLKAKHESGKSWIKFIFDKNSLMFSWQDLKDFGATMKWFFGLGKRPDYGRWTYWEKFDYFAVFWGVAVIGLSGLIKWFPEFFTIFLPGWLINVAAIIHSDEALLAVGFIFTIHFFNTHLRPGAFPMDKVMFTGVIPIEEYKEDRPRDYQQLVESGELKNRIVSEKMAAQREKVVTVFGYIALLIGLSLIGLILYSMLYGYN